VIFSSSIYYRRRFLLLTFVSSNKLLLLIRIRVKVEVDKELAGEEIESNLLEAIRGRRSKVGVRRARLNGRLIVFIYSRDK